MVNCNFIDTQNTTLSKNVHSCLLGAITSGKDPVKTQISLVNKVESATFFPFNLLVISQMQETPICVCLMIEWHMFKSSTIQYTAKHVLHVALVEGTVGTG